MTTRQAIQAALSLCDKRGYEARDHYRAATSPSAMRQLFAEFDSELAAAAERERVLREALEKSQAVLKQTRDNHWTHWSRADCDFVGKTLTATDVALKGSQP